VTRATPVGLSGIFLRSYGLADSKPAVSVLKITAGYGEAAKTAFVEIIFQVRTGE
jgi:hypothetical protein